MSGPSPARGALRDISNDTTPQPSPASLKAQPDSEALCDQATPVQTAAAWTTGDRFQFVEEDDDEVLFRVRDSGVLRSLALPGLSRPNAVTPPNAVNADETLDQKQARVRELRLSLERKPSALPSLKDALAGVMEADGASEESETGKELPKMQRPPPVLDDNLWDEITTEVKRKSMYEPVLVEDDADESEQSAVEEAVTESAPALQEEVTPAASVDAEPSLDDLANHIKAQIAGALAGTPAQDEAETKRELSPGDESFHSCDEGEGEAQGAPDALEAVKKLLTESPAAGMTRGNLIAMGFSEEEADWAVQQAKDQECDGTEEAAPAAAAAPAENVTTPAKSAPAAAPDAATPAHKVTTPAKEVPACEAAVPAAADLAEKVTTPAKEASAVEAAAPDAAAPAEKVTTPTKEVPALVAAVPAAAAPAEKVTTPAKEFPATVAASADAAVDKCISKAGCTCTDCTQMAGFTLATVNTAPVEEAITEEPIQAPISEDEVEVAAEPSPVKATEDATSPAKVVAPVEQQPDAEAMEPEASMQASPAPAAVSNSTPSKAVMLAASPAKEAVSQEPVAEAVEPDASVQASPAPAAVANSPPAKAAVAASPVAAMTKCIRRAGCTCPDCAEMSGLSLKPTEEDAGAIKCIRKAGCNCADCSVMAGLTLASLSPAKTDGIAEDKENADEQLLAKVVTPSKTPAKTAAGSAKKSALRKSMTTFVHPSAASVKTPVAAARAAVVKSASKSASNSSPAAAITKCIRRAGCTCPDCAEMSGLSLKPTEEDAGAIKCIRKAGCNCADCSVMAGLTLTTASPAKAVEETVEEQEPTPTADADIAAVPSPAKEVVPAKEEPVQEALSDEPAAEVEAPTAPVPASPPAKAAVAASPAGAMIKCIRRAGCTCPDCAEMSGLTLASAAPTQALVEEAPPAEEAAVMEVAAVPASPAKEVIAEIETPPVPPSPVKKIAATAEPNLPEATSAESRAPQVTVQQGATFAAQGNAQGKCIRKPACMSCDCAEMSGLALAPKAATAEVKCIRKAGCTCPDCAEMQGLSCAAAPFAAPVKEKTAPASPAQAAPTSAKKSAKKSAVKKSAVKFAQSPAFKAVPEFKSMSPAFSKDEESDVFSPEGFANAEALKAMLEDDGLELDDMTDLRISAVNESMRAEMKAALAQMHAAKDSAAKDSANTKELRTQDEVQCEIASEWGAPKLSEAGKEACAAPSCGASNSADARYTLEDVERISSFNMEALKRRMETEISELCTKLDASRKDAKTSNQALEDENTLLKKTMQEAETAIDELVAVVDTEKKDGAKHLKSFTDMKSYADELENAFNGLHGRYTKLKEYYKASDENNQVLSKSMLDTNELLKTHQTQLQAANDKMKTLEDKVIVERQSRSSELSLVTDKLTLAERQLSTSDATMLHLKMETHKAQQDLTRERLKLEDAKASFSQQLKSLGGGSKDADDRACKAQAEITELKMQMRMVKEAAAAAEANKDDAAALKMMKIQLQKAEIDKRGLAQQIEQKTKENEELNKMCDELLSDLEKKKCS